MCVRVGLTYDDMSVMTIGMCLDFIDEYVEQNDIGNGKKGKDNNQSSRKASQNDFDNF